MVSVLGLGILLLPQSISSPNSTPPSTSNNDIVENSIEAATSVDSRTSGSLAGWNVNKPFALNDDSSMFLGNDGYLYGTGYNGGVLGKNSTTSSTSFFKLYKSGSNTTANYFKDPIDFNIGETTGLIIDSDGKVWSSGTSNTNGRLGNGNSSTQRTFQQVITSTATNMLPTDYKAIAVSAGSTSLLLTEDGALYGAGAGNLLGLATTATTNSTFRRLDGVASGLPANGGASGLIRDFRAIHSYTYVLYENGDLYFTSSNASYYNKYTKIASDITMFDIDQESSATGTVYRAYIYNDKTNMIQYHTPNTMTLVDLVTPAGTPIQIKGTSMGWGYLNDNNELRLSSSSTSTSPGATNNTPLGKVFYIINNIAYFDLGGCGGNAGVGISYGIMTTDGQMKFWGFSDSGQLGNGSTSSKTYAAATTPTNGTYPVDSIPDLTQPFEPDFGLSHSNPPAVKKALVSNFYEI